VSFTRLGYLSVRRSALGRSAPEVAVTGTAEMVLADGGGFEGSSGLFGLLLILLILYLLFRK
jgi:hypothetical protein